MFWFELFQSNWIDFEKKVWVMIWRISELLNWFEESATVDLMYLGFSKLN